MCDINDINLEILSWIDNLKVFMHLSFLDKKSYILITDTPIYMELNILKTHNAKFKLNENNMIDIYYELGLIDILKKLKKNNIHFFSANGINYASRNGHINILEW